MIAQPACNIRIFALTITMLGLLPGCGSQPLERPADRRAPVPVVKSEGVAEKPRRAAERPRNVGEKAAAVALQQVGIPYRYGGNSRSGFDCSGLVQYSYRLAGKRIARTTGQLWSSTETVARRDLRAGDLLFFSIEGKMSHVGMYLGGERFVHAPSSGRTVTVARLNSPYYSAALIRAGRPK